MVPAVLGTGSRQTILVVDDSDDMRSSISELLEEEGYKVHQAGDGGEAFDEMSRMHEVPDLILLDLMMPGMDGYMMIEALQDDTMLAKIPVIVVSGHSAEKVPGTAMTLEKPFERALLMDAVARYISSD